MNNNIPVLPLILGKDRFGETKIIDVAECPHILIGGSIDREVTAYFYTLIFRLLDKLKPNRIKFIIIDFGKLEFNILSTLPNLLCSPIKDVDGALETLSWLVNEMERRYILLAKYGKRNIELYNEMPKTTSPSKLPYIILFVNDFGVLLKSKGSKSMTEYAVTRLAQLSRAVGIHLIFTTQGVSLSAISPLIKFQFPTRISFKVPSLKESLKILDIEGAENLLNTGDMLFINPEIQHPIFLHSSFIGEKEIVSFIKSDQNLEYDAELDTLLRKVTYGYGEAERLDAIARIEVKLEKLSKDMEPIKYNTSKLIQSVENKPLWAHLKFWPINEPHLFLKNVRRRLSETYSRSKLLFWEVIIILVLLAIF